MPSVSELERVAQSRPHGLGASDAAAAVGLSPWKTPWQLYLEKTGQIPQQPMSQAMKLGLLLEPIVAQLYEEEKNCRLVTSPVIKHDSIPWLFCSPDRFTSSGRLVQLKTASGHTSEEWGEPGSDQVPTQYLIQQHHEMIVCNKPECDLAVLIGGQDFRVYTIVRNEKLAKGLLEKEKEFWDRVERNHPPEPDFSIASDREIVRELFGVEETEVQLGAEELELVHEYQSANEHLKTFDEIKQLAKAKLLHAMKEASKAVLPDGTILTRKVIERKGYEVKPCQYVDFRIKRSKS